MISAAQARRLACQAGIIPAVLGGVVLDLGRKRRFHTAGQRNGRLLCPRHHARAHDPAFTMTKLATGKVQFVRRT